GIDYDEVFAPVARIEMVRVILALAGSSGWWVHHLDVKSAFLNERLEEGVQHETGITLKQDAYAKNILNKTWMMDCNATRSPMEHKLKLSKDEERELADPTEYRSIVGALSEKDT
nr:hypothetical protein [Tanacetum cinerariifolium]